jgi:hypothetical protein
MADSTCYSSSSPITKAKRAVAQTVESSIHITSYMSSKNPSQLREPTPGLEPAMDGYNLP